MLTYLGNKRKLLKSITDIVSKIGTDLKVLDAFSGSGVVARALVPFSKEVHANDWKTYSYAQARCFIEKPSPTEEEKLACSLANPEGCLMCSG